ncbi:autotransporter outer membrane beta-barrel domain-containing protein [Phascolarctobacterium faecium]|jgi:outer membrane autotransporter protein|uniref:Autotransporter outer membrane beta-barrel domain-containing protein n=1 Tax=Phascolarctobacterium faecium TaxID=33025 RepID=A0A7X2XH09_9FIRM|nr:autotransporter outer membrane beta-barrel domain-containing protein [Phascolarctobacterium faecium]MTS81511.1 autotransporter outer membrane beta-barrel domain-containing protein [Phascolarctobacterium faecium]MTT02739.1 autotransporter outer membrane beta-barrel domain-containing protein [Phascolarctobacterium faecium]MTT16823.1 autotransporter outer membrane beta-barrel domain-containing protein [Phascolarctobacterium faecium]MTT34921.1 autotransporter outer membrane beta-barrel domain-co
MLKKPGLAKKIAHTLMAMSIVYSSGINVVVNEVYAQEIITSSNKTIKKSGDPGHSYYEAGGITDGGSVEVNGVIDSSSNLSAADDIEVKAAGGEGGDDNGSSPTTMQGSNGGDGVAKITIDESLSSVTLGKLMVSAYGGANGSVYQGTAGTNGAATAYGLQLKHDLSISVADIGISAKTNKSSSSIVINNNARSQAVGVGVQFDGGKVSFTGTKMKLTAIGASGSSSAPSSTITAACDGGAVASYGFRVQDGEATIQMSDKISFGETFGSAGDSLTYMAGSGVAGGNGGEMTVFGVEVNGGIAHLDLQDIGNDSSNYFVGGAGGGGQSIDGTVADRAGTGGDGGKTTVAGIHTAGGSVDGTVGQIKLSVKSGRGGEGGRVNNINKIGGSGGDGGDIYSAGIKADAGRLQLTVAGVDLETTGGSGGNISQLETYGSQSSHATVTATGVQKSGGTGGAAFAAGVDNRGGSSDVTAAGLVKVTAHGGGGGEMEIYGQLVLDNASMNVMKAECISGVGGVATAAGLRNTAGTLTADVQKLEITAVGGNGATGGSTYSYAGLDGGLGGAAVAYGINVASGLVESITATEIAVTCTGGAGGAGGGSSVLSDSSDGGAGRVGGNGSNGADGTAYGVGNSGGLLKHLSIGSITAAAVGGAGGAGGFVQKGITATAGGIGGNGGNGGNAYAYGVWCSGAAAVTAVAADTVTATAKAGDAGLGAAVNSGNVLNGVAITGAAGTKGEEAKAYGIYADQGAVIELGEKTTGSGITIGAQATNGETVNEAYAVYAGNGGTVLFHTDAVLNGDGSGGTDNDVVTALADGTLGFSGTSADRSVTGGALRLTGSNEFRVTTDLANNGADKFTFAKLAAGSSTEAQYITVGYDKSFDGSSLSSINGDVTVLTVSDLNGQNLDNFVGKKTTLDNPLERFTATPTVVTNGNDVKITQIDFAKNTDGNTASETAMTLSDAQMAMGSMWRIEGNNLMKRMGELRSDKEAAKGGVWARYYRGELSADSAYDRNFSQDYTAFQGGIDKVQDFKGGKLYTGIAVNRIDSNAGYTAGSGDLSSTGIGLYASWLGSKGHYLDIIARGSKLTNDFKLVDLSGNAAKADYDTWAYGISAEYGYRQDLNAGWFVEPQAELSLGHMGSADYTTSNEVSVKQDSVNSAVTRIGILGGKEFTIGGRPSNAYVKASLLHDFGGNGGATAYYGTDSLALQTGDLTGTWYEIGLGANLGIAKNSNLYFDALKTFNGTVRTDWQFNAGLRFTF